MDFAFVFLQSFDVWMQNFGMKVNKHSGYMLRIMRLARMARVVRISRILNLVPNLRVLVIAISNALQASGWVLGLILMEALVVGIVLTDLVTDHKVAIGRDEMEDSQEELLHYYGTLDRSVLSLYQTISDGIHWNEIMEPVANEISPFLKIVFVLYSAFAIFVTMNIITGFFVETALSVAGREKKMMAMQALSGMWSRFDTDGSGAVGVEEFVETLRSPAISSHLRDIDLCATDAAQLFAVLDDDDSGEIGADELLNGCARLSGQARALDLAICNYNQQKSSTFMVQKFEECLCRFDDIEDVLDSFKVALSGIINGLGHLMK